MAVFGFAGVSDAPISAIVFGCRKASMSTSRSWSARPDTSTDDVGADDGADDLVLGMQRLHGRRASGRKYDGRVSIWASW